MSNTFEELISCICYPILEYWQFRKINNTERMLHFAYRLNPHLSNHFCGFITAEKQWMRLVGRRLTNPGEFLKAFSFFSISL